MIEYPVCSECGAQGWSDCAIDCPMRTDYDDYVDGREYQRFKARHGMRVKGRSVRLLARLIGRSR